MVNLIAGFLKGRNLILRGDLYRIIQNLEQIVDEVFYLDDASYDGTYEWMRDYLGKDHVLRVHPDQHDFARELEYKQELLDLIHKNGPWQWVLWQDSDEVLDAKGTATLRKWCEDNVDKKEIKGLMMHYCQLWRNTSWARTDSQFDDGNFVKLWRYEPTLTFEIKPGTHHYQFPQQFIGYLKDGKIKQADFECIHYGNVGENLKFKCLNYYGGLGGVDRHLNFSHATYRPVSVDQLPPGVDILPGDEPKPFTKEQVSRILQMENLKELKDTFCVIIPAYNRGEYLPKTLDSILAQTYEKWICVILDDGSTDNTPYVVSQYLDKDPRFFYCRYLQNRGGVAMNEIGMEIAVNTAEYWVRLGSDDWFEPYKLENDYKAFQIPEVNALYNTFQVYRNGSFDEMANFPIPPAKMKEGFTKGGFYASWAGVAARSSVLKKVKEIYGNYVDSRLRNMEDFLFNFRVSRIVDWHWRGIINGKYTVLLDPDMEVCNAIQDGEFKLTPESYWRINQVGASADGGTTGRDQAITLQLIQEELKKYA